MGARYAYLVDFGYSADYLDKCTLLDLDLFIRKANELRERSAS